MSGLGFRGTSRSSLPQFDACGTEAEAVRNSGIALNYEVTSKVIYSGLASTIFLGFDFATRLTVCIKVIKHCESESVAERLDALAEVQLHSQIPPHPNVVRLLATEVAPSGNIILVTPFAPRGDLWALTRYGQTYCEREVRNCATQMFAGLHHVHEVCDMVHGDIKPHNFLLFTVEDRLCVQLCDFGLAQRPDTPGGIIAFKGLRGTSGWFAPEMLEGHNYGFGVDLFSTALILFRMLGGYAPFEPPASCTREPPEFHDQYWCHISAPCRNFLDQLLSVHPAERGTARAACCHEWIAGPPPEEPTAEQMRELTQFGPPPATNVCFWYATEVPDQSRQDCFAG